MYYCKYLRSYCCCCRLLYVPALLVYTYSTINMNSTRYEYTSPATKVVNPEARICVPRSTTASNWSPSINTTARRNEGINERTIERTDERANQRTNEGRSKEKEYLSSGGSVTEEPWTRERVVSVGAEWQWYNRLQQYCRVRGWYSIHGRKGTFVIRYNAAGTKEGRKEGTLVEASDGREY